MNNQNTRSTFTVERGLRMVAGIVVLVSVSLGWFVHPGWFGLTAFVGLNLLQSAFTNWCPMVWLLEKLGLPRAVCPLPEHSQQG